jgi:hypothetical protein
MLVYQDLQQGIGTLWLQLVVVVELQRFLRLVILLFPIAAAMAIIANVVCVAIISAWEIFDVVYGVVGKPLVPMKKRF